MSAVTGVGKHVISTGLRATQRRIEYQNDFNEAVCPLPVNLFTANRAVKYDATSSVQ